MISFLFSVVNQMKKTNNGIEGFHSGLNGNLEANSAYKHFYKFFEVIKKENRNQLQDYDEFNNCKRRYKMAPDYEARLCMLEMLTTTYFDERTSDTKKLEYLDAVISVLQWNFAYDRHDPDYNPPEPESEPEAETNVQNPEPDVQNPEQNDQESS